MGKGEIARYEQFLLFPQCFLFNQIIVSPFVHIFDIISLFAAELEEPKIGKSVKGFRYYKKGRTLFERFSRLHSFIGDLSKFVELCLRGLGRRCRLILWHFKLQKRPTRKVFVYKIQVNPHSYHLKIWHLLSLNG